MKNPTFPSSRIREINDIREEMWKRLEREYISAKHKWRKSVGRFQAIESGDMVQVVNKRSPAGFWSIGVIEDIKISKDGQYPKFKIRMQDGTHVIRSSSTLHHLKLSPPPPWKDLKRKLPNQASTALGEEGVLHL